MVWSIKNLARYLVNWSQEVFMRLVCPLMISLNTTLRHSLIKEKFLDLIECAFKKEGTLYLACNDKKAFFTSTYHKGCKLWSCQNFYIRFGNNLYR